MIYLCRMTTQQAFISFWELIHDNGAWEAMDAKERRRISSAKDLCLNERTNKKGSPQRLTPKRAFAIFEKYAPGAFRVVQPEVYFERV